MVRNGVKMKTRGRLDGMAFRGRKAGENRRRKKEKETKKKEEEDE